MHQFWEVVPEGWYLSDASHTVYNTWTVAPGLQAAPLVHGKLPRLQVAHGVIAAEQSVVVELLLLRFHEVPLVENLGDAASRVALAPVVGASALGFGQRAGMTGRRPLFDDGSKAGKTRRLEN